MIKLLKLMLVLISFSSHALKPISICMTGKLELALPEYKTALLNAVNLALSEHPISNKVQIKTFFYDNKPLTPIRAYNKMLKEHCLAIIGFEYLTDLLLITKIQRDLNIPIFTSYASSNPSDKLPKNIFMFMPTYEYHAKKMLQFLQLKYKKINKVLLVTELDRVDLVKYKLAYQTLLKSKKISYDTFDFIGTDNTFDRKLAKFLRGKKYNFVFLLSGAGNSSEIINFMNDHKIIFIGTENFGSSTNQSLFVRLKDKTINVFAIRNLDFLKEDKSLAHYRQKYTAQYAIKPSPLSIYIYDAMTLILNVLEQKKSINTDQVLETHFNGITGAFIKKKTFHRSNHYIILSMNEKGFVYEQ